jgi:site-specific DNA recombinase
MKSTEAMNYEGVKAFLIARVSDTRQSDALPAQNLRLEEYAARLKLNYEYFSFDETAYKEDRQRFKEIVNQIYECPTFCIVVFNKIDRFARDASTEVVMILKRLVREGKIELHFPSDNLLFHKNSPAADKTRLGMGMVFGEYYSAAISDNVKRRIEQKLHDGEFPGKAPIGYKNVADTDDLGKVISKNIVPDPARRGYIEKAFELRLEGKSFRSIAKILKDDGLRANTNQQGVVSQSQMETMLKNSFYYGVMKYDGGEYPHKYEPIITKQLFDKVQAINDVRNNERDKTLTKQTFTFQGILKCATCGCSYSSYVKKGRVYMRCTKAKEGVTCDQPPTSEENLLPQVAEVLEKLAISERRITEVLDVLKKGHDDIQLYYRNAISETRAKIESLNKKMDILYDDRLDGRITSTDYDKYVKKYKADKAELEQKLVEYTNNDQSFVVTSEYLLKLAQNAISIFESSQPATKNRILRTLLANCKINQKRLQLNLLQPFHGLLSCSVSENWLTTIEEVITTIKRDLSLNYS